MEFGVCIASQVTDIDYAVTAERLGFSHAWFADSQMLWSDCYACLALAAVKTSRIKLGTGVAVAGTRPASVNAAAIATVNALAPGRTFFGTGAGNTATRIMGLPPMRIKQFDRYLAEIVPLIRGEEALTRRGEQNIPIRHLMPDLGFVNFKQRVPVYVSGFGPRSLALAGRYGDGAVLAMPASAEVMNRFWSWIEEGVRVGERSMDRASFYTTALTAIVVLQPGEAVTAARVKAQCGAMATSAIHFAYDQWRNFGQPPPPYLQGIWDDYTALLETVPENRRHQRIHAGHNCWVLPEEEQFLTEEVLRSTCMIGTQDELLQRIDQLQQAGLDQLMILPNFATRYEVLEDVAAKLIAAA